MPATSFTPRLPLPLTPHRPVTAAQTAAPGADADDTLRERLLATLQREPWWDAGTSNVYVEQGTVVLQGLVRNDAARLAARRAAEAMPGVRRVWDARVPAREWQSMA